MFNTVYVLRMTKFVRKCNFPNLLLLLPFPCNISNRNNITLIVGHVPTDVPWRGQTSPENVPVTAPPVDCGYDHVVPIPSRNTKPRAAASPS